MDNRVESSYVFNISGDNSDESPAMPSWLSPSDSSSSPCSSASSSSIGMNSDDDGEKSSEDGGDDTGDNEVESPYKGSLEMMESLEQVLPVRKGISKYYNGKSKSFTNLKEEASSALTSSSSMKDLVAKPENPYSRRRRNLLCHQIWENNSNSKTTPRGGISKKHVMSSSRSALTLAMAVMTGGEGSSSGSGGDSSPGSSPTTSGSPPRQRHHHHHQMVKLPPLYPRSQGSFSNLTSSQSSLGFCAWRSYSVADFPRCFPATASGIGFNDS
ncbi:PREDICTED: uncharacterized protein LOC104770517 [Camelina sativa]|uniref:Uncharacterized protein LOC104770517 n=1 Tax=Camelina sativa TaxID=90675 RepID=A0ABM0XZJ8_CAMSA|nr:PREDICTED: uncharacterized protein LOC104770517 [Camelina sativa]